MRIGYGLPWRWRSMPARSHRRLDTNRRPGRMSPPRGHACTAPRATPCRSPTPRDRAHRTNFARRHREAAPGRRRCAQHAPVRPSSRTPRITSTPRSMSTCRRAGRRRGRRTSRSGCATRWAKSRPLRSTASRTTSIPSTTFRAGSGTSATFSVSDRADGNFRHDRDLPGRFWCVRHCGRRLSDVAHPARRRAGRVRQISNKVREISRIRKHLTVRPVLKKH